MAPTICLSMIVKNEAHVIERCLSSVRPHIDHWVIVDTGSTDGTQDLVRTLMADLPGALIERPWVDFGHNRSEALAVARDRADYSFVIDADEVLDTTDGCSWTDLHADAGAVDVRLGLVTYRRVALLANRRRWEFHGVLHEYPAAADDTGTRQILPSPVVVVHCDGARSQGVSTEEKYSRDARTLEEALRAEPDNARYQFYLARSYLHAGQFDAALAAFRRRAEMAGFVEETADALLEIGRLLERQGATFEQVHQAYLTAWESRPTRAEPLYELARYCRAQHRFAIGRMAAWQAMFIPRPDDSLWVMDDVYTWRCLDEFAVAAYFTGRYAEAEQACRKLLDGGHVPPDQLPRVRANLEFSRAGRETASAPPRIPEQPRRDAGVVRPIPIPLTQPQ